MTNRRSGENSGSPTMNDHENVEDIVQEYDALNNTLDMLDGCLDQLEHRNDSLFAKLEDLLQSSKETREELASAAESVREDLAQGDEDDVEKSKDGDEDVNQAGPHGTDVKHSKSHDKEGS
ncbi:UPF0184 protein-like [Lineus longissimus]|uniref:UPF0184 protein-like n=1 Tax=Lineus longissimus TaxID=88925 RepID=UPI002B4C5A6F